MSEWSWVAIYAGLLAACALLVALVRATRAERDQARQQLIAMLGQQAADRYLATLMQRWAEQSEGVEFADGDEAAHAFADFLANQTGQPIVAQQLDGDGVIVAIPDQEAPDA
jgi:hypothetical protein